MADEDDHEQQLADLFEQIVSPCSVCDGPILYMGQLGGRVTGRCRNCYLETSKMENELYLYTAIKAHHARLTPQEPMTTTYEIWKATLTIELATPQGSLPGDVLTTLTHRLHDDVAKMHALLVDLDRGGGLGQCTHDRIRAVLGGIVAHDVVVVDGVPTIVEANITRTERKYAK